MVSENSSGVMEYLRERRYLLLVLLLVVVVVAAVNINSAMRRTISVSLVVDVPDGLENGHMACREAFYGEGGQIYSRIAGSTFVLETMHGSEIATDVLSADEEGSDNIGDTWIGNETPIHRCHGDVRFEGVMKHDKYRLLVTLPEGTEVRRIVDAQGEGGSIHTDVWLGHDHRPSVKAIAAANMRLRPSLTNDQATCTAEAIYNSGVSDVSLRKLVRSTFRAEIPDSDASAFSDSFDLVKRTCI